MLPVRIASFEIGDGRPCFTIAEIGINHNGDMEIAKKLIRAAKISGFQAVKFQKRTVDLVYSPEELAKPRPNPFGPTNGDLKRGLEFGKEQYTEIDRLCRESDIVWFASCWDEESVAFMEFFDPPCYKIASACLTDDKLLTFHTKMGRPIILSSGMSSPAEIDHAVEIVGKRNLILMHSTSTYPAQPAELNLRVIPWLKSKFDVPTGYSGHEVGLAPTIAAVALGANAIERHVTLDRAMWGTDQAASIEPPGMTKLIKDISAVETSLGDGIKRVYDSEIPVRNKLRRPYRPSELTR